MVYSFWVLGNGQYLSNVTILGIGFWVWGNWQYLFNNT
jgi:hypothetical protein